MCFEFLDPETYNHLCENCIKVLKEITQRFEEDEFPDTDDEEEPINFMYDHKLFCGGHVCVNHRVP